MSTTPISTPLESEHLRLGAKLVPFAGWKMPVQYASITDEHHAVRKGAGVFDISHMGQVEINGSGALRWLESMLANRVSALAVGQGQYTFLLNETGGVIDDLIVYRTGEESFFAVINASKTEEDMAWLTQHLPDEGVTLHLRENVAGLAVQGPNAPSLIDTPPAKNQIILREDGAIICGTGYTGEAGFELFCAADQAATWLNKFLSAGAKPCGLGARDTLRLEMAYPLNGQDLSPTRTPLEAGMGFFVDLEKDFIGSSVLKAQKGTAHDRLCGLQQLEPGAPLRAHYPVLAEGQQIGELCSGGLAPSLGSSIGLAYLPAAWAKVGTKLTVSIRGKDCPVQVVKKPFYRKES